MEAVQRLRESINEQLDRLVEEIEMQRNAFALHGDRISWAEEEGGQQHAVEGELISSAPFGDNEQRKVSAKGSPSRVSFSDAPANE